MAALGRQVLGGQRLVPLSWACVARRTSHPPERGRTKQTTASHGGSLEEAFRVGPRNSVQQPVCRTNPVQGLPEKQSTPVDSGSLEPEKVISSLLDMGFSDAHVKDLLSTLPGKLRRMLHGCPEVFTMRQQDIDDTVKLLKEKCLFTAQQVTEILHRCPSVLQENPSELEYKFQYAYFRMGVKHLDIVRTDFLQYSVNKIKQRHSYLERLGRYQTPDKKGQTQITNPLLKDILRVSESEFLAKTACSSAEEFEVFKKLLAREEEEQEEEEEPESSTSEDKEEQL
nr:transcription termination factor 4, mitochondrial isoform X2 [Marmota flaviventris]